MLFAAAAGVALLALVPLLFVGSVVADLGVSQTLDLVLRPRTFELLKNTFELVGLSLLICTVLGTAAAWLVVRTTLPLRQVWHALLVAPLAVPAFVNSFGWVSLTPRVEGFGGAVLVVSLSYYPFVYLPVVASLRGLDPALEETAQTLGYGPGRTFVRVVLPQLRPALLGGGLLVALHLLAEFGALQLLRYDTFTTAIYDQYQSSFNGPAANALASVLLLCCLVLLLMELGLRGRTQYARLGGGASRGMTPISLRWTSAPALLALGAMVGLAIGVPVFSLLRWLIQGTSTAFPVHELLSATGTTLGLALAAAVLTSVLAVPVAWLSVRHRGAASTVVERLTYFGGSLPGIVVALALVTVSLRVLTPAYQTTGLLLIGYTVLFLPRAVVSQRSAAAQIPPVFDDVAHALGSGSIATLRRVTLPLLARGVGVGAAFVFLAVVTELTTTLLLSPIGTETLATGFWQEASSVAYGAAAPYAALMVLISAPATWLLTRTALKR